MTTLDYVQNLKFPFDQPTVAQKVENIRRAILEVAPEWRPEDQGLLIRALTPIADQLWTDNEVMWRNMFRFTLPFAIGDDLDVVGDRFGILRMPDESDLAYRLRLYNRRRDNSLGSLASILANAYLSNSLIVDAAVNLAANRQDATLYCLKANNVQLTAQEREAVRLYVNANDRLLMGVVVTVAQPTITPYDLRVTVTYDNRVTDEPTMRMRVEESLSAWLLANNKLNRPVYVSAVLDAAFVENAVNVVVTSPASTLVASPGVVHLGNMGVTLNSA